MANPLDLSPGSVPGFFYVDSTCIDCDLCRSTAPATFRRNDETGWSLVYHQPTTPEEIDLATEAMDGCPSNSIGTNAPAASG